MDFEKLKKEIAVGWNTWNVESMTSYVCLPYGFGINLAFKDYSQDIVLRNCNVGGNDDLFEIRPMPRTYDMSYTELSIEFAQTKLKVQSTEKNGEPVVLVTPVMTGLKPPLAIAEAGFLWGKDGSIKKSNGTISAQCGEKNFQLYTSGSAVNYPYAFSNAFYIAVSLDAPTVFSTFECGVEEAVNLIEAAKSDMDKKDRAYGELYEAVRAMRACLAWNTVYEPENGFVYTPVSRLWAVRWDGFVLFPWDSFFISLMLSHENIKLAQLNTLAVVQGMTEKGFIPNFRCANGYISADRSNPPVGSYVCLQIYKQNEDKEYLRNVYDKLLIWNEWFWNNRRTGEGTLAWGSEKIDVVYGKSLETYHINTTKGATFESGMDCCSVYNDVEFDEEKSVMKLEDTALTSLYYLDCSSLAEMSKILSKDYSLIEKRMNKVKSALGTMWDDKKGIFNSRSTESGEFSEHIGPMSFWPLFGGCADDLCLERMLKENFYNPKRFWGEYMLPTVSRDDAAFAPDESLFRGRIWPPVNFITYLALKSAGCIKECEILVNKSINMFMNEWLNHNHVHENHHPQTGSGDVEGSFPFYGWGALYAYMAIDYKNIN